MAGTTKLFQRAGSPLIQGRSRYARSFLADWVTAWLWSVVGSYAALVVLVVTNPTAHSVATVRDTLLVAALPGLSLVASLVASGLAVWTARGLGLRRAWLAGALVGIAAGVVVVLYSW